MSPEDCRYELRRYLAAMPTASVSIDTISHGLRRWGVNATPAEIEAAALFLNGLEPRQIMITINSLGSAKRYQITSVGLLAYERNE